MLTDKLRETLLSAMLEYGEDHGMCILGGEYCEPGYTSEYGAVFSDWNDKKRYIREENRHETLDSTPSRLATIFEWLGLEIEWQDEWSYCSTCYKWFRISGDCWGWKLYAHFSDGEYNCGDCILDDPDSYLEELNGDTRHAITIDGVNPEKHGWSCLNWDNESYYGVNSFESGWYSGQTDSPERIAQVLQGVSIYDFVFDIRDIGQFDIHFVVWIPNDAIGATDEMDHDEKVKRCMKLREELGI